MVVVAQLVRASVCGFVNFKINILYISPFLEDFFYAQNLGY